MLRSLVPALVVIGSIALVAVACSDDPPASQNNTSSGGTSGGTSSGGTSGGAGTSGGSSGQDSDSGADSGESSTPPSTDANAPVELEVGKPFSAAPPAGMGLHFFKFTVPTAGKYQITLNGPRNLHVNWCTESKETGCACDETGEGTTCCTIAEGAESCTYVAEDVGQTALPAGTVIYPFVTWFGAASEGTSYTLTIAGPTT